VSASAACRHIGASPSKISRLEGGKCAIKEADLDNLLNLYGVTDGGERQALLEFASRLNDWKSWDPRGDVVDGWLSSYLVLESIAQTIRTYEATFIPGLLQTPAYAEAVVRLHHADEDQIRRRVAVRMRRQRAVLERGKPLLWAVVDRAALDEAAVPGGVTQPEVMREQIEFLIRAANRPNVIVQILKRGAAAREGFSTSFSLLRLRLESLADVAYLEHIGDALFLDRPDKSDRYRQAMTRLSIAAGEPRAALETLKEALADIGV
jgi:hypothetical protein